MAARARRADSRRSVVVAHRSVVAVRPAVQVLAADRRAVSPLSVAARARVVRAHRADSHRSVEAARRAVRREFDDEAYAKSTKEGYEEGKTEVRPGRSKT